MGVPGFFAWLMRKGKELKWKGRMVSEEIYDEPDADWLLLDTNGLLHPCCFKVLEEQEKAGTNLSIPELEALMFDAVIAYLNKLINLINPVKGVFIAIDGVAPAAKMKQQRQRRFKSSNDKIIFDNLKLKHGIPVNSEEWSNSVISPGTDFMERLHNRILLWAENYNDNFPSDWPIEEKREKRTIIYSSYHTPMEGEHKLVQFIRDNNSNDGSKGLRYIIYGLDADLFFLALGLGNAGIFLLREEQQLNIKGEQRMDVHEFAFVNLDAVREFIILVIRNYFRTVIQKERKVRMKATVVDTEGFTSSAGSESPEVIELDQLDIPASRNESLIKDFVLICFLLGNDFLPHLPALNIYTNGIQVLLTKYCELLVKYGCQRYLVASSISEHGISTFSSDTIIDSFLFSELLLNLGEIEEQVLRDAANKKKRKPFNPFHKPYEKEKFCMENLIFPEPLRDPVGLGKGQVCDWKERYYNYYGIPKGNDSARYEAAIDEVCLNYLVGIKYILLYYFDRCPSWEWLYMHDFPPFLSDVQSFISRTDFRMSDVTFPSSTGPVTPFEQFMSILPADKATILPAPISSLMVNKLSSLGSLIPSEYTQDLQGRDKFWQAVPVLPKMNLSVVRDAYNSVVEALTDEQKIPNTLTESFTFNAF